MGGVAAIVVAFLCAGASPQAKEVAYKSRNTIKYANKAALRVGIFSIVHACGFAVIFLHILAFCYKRNSL